MPGNNNNSSSSSSSDVLPDLGDISEEDYHQAFNGVVELRDQGHDISAIDFIDNDSLNNFNRAALELAIRVYSTVCFGFKEE